VRTRPGTPHWRLIVKRAGSKAKCRGSVQNSNGETKTRDAPLVPGSQVRWIKIQGSKTQAIACSSKDIRPSSPVRGASTQIKGDQGRSKAGARPVRGRDWSIDTIQPATTTAGTAPTPLASAGGHRSASSTRCYRWDPLVKHDIEARLTRLARRGHCAVRFTTCVWPFLGSPHILGRGVRYAMHFPWVWTIRHIGGTQARASAANRKIFLGLGVCTSARVWGMDRYSCF